MWHIIIDRWSENGFRPCKQLKGKPNWIENWPTLGLTCFSGCLCQFLTSQKLKQQCGITFPKKANPRVRKTRRARKLRAVCMQHQSASLRLVHQATRMPNLLLTGKCLPENLSSSVTPHGRPLRVWVDVYAQNKHTPSLVWASNEGGDFKRESAFFWVLAGILVRIPFCLLLHGGWYEGWYSNGERDHLSPEPGKDGKDRTGQDKTWWDRTGKANTSLYRQGRQNRPGRTKPHSEYSDWLRGLDQPFQLLPASHFCGIILPDQHKMKWKARTA